MIATLRRSALGLVFAAQWVAPYLLPIHAVFSSDPRQDAAGWYLALALSTVWPLLLVWSVVTELPRWERKATATDQLPWLLAIATGVVTALAGWALYGGGDRLDPEMFASAIGNSALAVHYIVVVHGGISVALPAFVVLASRAIKRPIEVSRVPLHRWVAGVALCLFLTPPPIGFAKFAGGILFVLASWTAMVRELPLIEERWPAKKWPLRVGALLVGAVCWYVNVDGEVHNYWGMCLLHLRAALQVAGIGLAFAALCITAADGLAWAMRRSRSVRVRMLVLGLACAVLAVALTQVKIPVEMATQPSVVNPLLSLVAKLVCLVVMIPAFSSTLSRGLSRSLEQSVRAISEIRRGNLDVALDESGRDEIAEVSRSFNQMVAQLREAEFLEKINADLRSRSTQLAQALEALRTAQTDLVRAERMASVATLVKGIAHELNNPINYIAGNIAPLARYSAFLTRVATELSDGRARGADELRVLTRLAEGKDLAFVSEDLARLTSDIGEGARRAQLIITDLQSLTSAAQRGIERVDLHRMVRQTIALLEPRVPPGVQLKAELTPVSTLPARAGQLEQVLVNLSDNALRAVGDQGVVRIYVGSIEDQAVVKVTDDGPGMTAEVRRQAFEPFFTTRSAGEGSGLGLAIVASIVRAHQGTVTLKSEPGKGTEVELRIPLDTDLVTKAELSSG